MPRSYDGALVISGASSPTRRSMEWLAVLARAQPPAVRNTAAGRARRTAVLAVLRGAMLDLLATGDHSRTSRAIREFVALTADP